MPDRPGIRTAERVPRESPARCCLFTGGGQRESCEIPYELQASLIMRGKPANRLSKFQIRKAKKLQKSCWV